MATRRKTTTHDSKNSTYVTVSLNLAYDLTFDIGDKHWTINGTNSNLRGVDGGILAVGKFGQTLIKKEDWEAIKAQYGSMDIFQKGFIFASEDKASAEDEAKDKEELRHGLEPIDTKTTKSTEDKQA